MTPARSPRPIRQGGPVGHASTAARVAPRGSGAPLASRRVVVVGPCASGKTTLVAGLRRLGYRAAVCGQEHSDIPTLWQHSAPDLVVALDVDLATLRRRRGEEWPEWLYLVQQRRLRAAAAAANVRVNTSVLDEAEVLDRVVADLTRHR